MGKRLHLPGSLALFLLLLPGLLFLPGCGSSGTEAARTPQAAGTSAPPASPPASPGQASSTAAVPQAAAPAAGTEGNEAWRPIYDFALEVDGAAAWDARFYVHKEGQKILIAAPEVASPAILNRASQDVGAIARTAVRTEGDGDAAFVSPGGDAPASTTPYTVDGDKGEVIFFLGPQRLKIIPKRPLEGPATAETILKHSPIYKKGMDGYAPKQSEVAYLQSVSSPVDIEVFFGTWCSHCKVLVPRFMKTMELAGNKALRVSFIGVPKTFNTYSPAQSKKVTGIPTFIFYRNGTEFGRIPGEPTDATIEEAVAKILRSAS